MKKIQEKIRTEALKWRGEKEIPHNQGFENKDLEAMMISVTGWKPGDAWCADLFKLIWYNAYSHYLNSILPSLDKLCSSSAVTTFRNFSKRPALTKYLFEIHQIPVIGAGIFFQEYKMIDGKLTAHWTGHAGVVTDLPDSPEEITNKLANNSPFLCTEIEGNTSESGSREGDEVGLKTRLIDYNPKPGLVPLGFVYPYVDEEMEEFIEMI